MFSSGVGAQYTLLYATILDIRTPKKVPYTALVLSVRVQGVEGLESDGLGEEVKSWEN